MKKPLLTILLMIVMCSTVYSATGESPEVDARPVSIYGKETLGSTTVTGLKVTSDGSIGIVGPTAVDAAFSTNPVVTGLVAESTVPTAVADGDVVKQWATTYGRAVGSSDDLATGSTSVTVVSPLPVASGCTPLIDTTLNANGESVNATMFIGDADKRQHLVCVLSADVDANNLELANDGTNYGDITVYDFRVYDGIKSSDWIAQDYERTKIYY